MWSPMTVDEFAESESANGAEITQVDGFYWRKIRPFFYRPLLVHQSYSPDEIPLPPGKFSACQYVVKDASQANSNINLMVYDDLANYSIENCRKHHRRHLRAALKSGMVFRPIETVEELVTKGYPVYCSFYERSRYDFGKDRLDKKVYYQWAEHQINHKGVLVMGVFLNDELLGIYISCRINNTVYLKTAINSKEAIRLRAPELSWHAYRETAREDRTIDLIVDGPYVPSDGINAFKFRRGARAIALPAYLDLNPLLLKGLRLFSSTVYQALKGFEEDEMNEKDFSDCHEG